MAIYANRVKTHSNYYSNFSSLIAIFYKRFLTVCLITLSCLLLNFGPIKYLSNISLEINASVIVVGIKIYDFVLAPINFISHKLALLDDLENKNIELKFKLSKLKTLKIKYELLEAENQSLKHILNIIPDKEYHRKRARLLSLSLNPFSKNILIGAGEQDGVEIDQIVASEEGLIGRIVQTNKNYAKVMLINDINSRVPVITSILGERAILAGENSQLTLLYLQDHSKIKDGEILLTSGDGRIYPYGLPVGKISKDQDNKVMIEPIVNLSEIDFVTIYNAYE